MSAATHGGHWAPVNSSISTVRLLLPFPAKQELKPGSTDKKAVIDVTLDDGIVPGYYQFWAVTDGGVTTPTLIGVAQRSRRMRGGQADRIVAPAFFVRAANRGG